MAVKSGQQSSQEQTHLSQNQLKDFNFIILVFSFVIFLRSLAKPLIFPWLRKSAKNRNVVQKTIDVTRHGTRRIMPVDNGGLDGTDNISDIRNFSGVQIENMQRGRQTSRGYREQKIGFRFLVVRKRGPDITRLFHSNRLYNTCTRVYLSLNLLAFSCKIVS